MRLIGIRDNVLSYVMLRYLLLSGVFLAAAPIHAALPQVPTLKPVQQSSVVQAILDALKESAGRVPEGTWSLTAKDSGHADRSYQLSVKGKQAYLRQSDVPASQILWWSEGAFYETGGEIPLCFGVDSLEARRGFAALFLLFNANLNPDVFVAGRELEGIPVEGGQVRLHADVSAYISRVDLYAVMPSNDAAITSIDYFYDNTRRTIVKLIVRFGNGQSLQSEAVEWDEFGTNAPFPKRIRSTWSNKYDRQLPGESVLQVNQYTAGHDNVWENTAAQMESIPFFSGDWEHLRRYETYQELLKNTDDTTTRIVLAQAWFRKGLPADGMTHWNTLNLRITDSKQRQALEKALLIPAARSLGKMRSLAHSTQADTAISLWERIAKAPLSSDEWRQVSYPMILAWSQYHAANLHRDRIAPLEDRVLKRSAEEGDCDAWVAMMRVAWSDKSSKLIAKVDPLLAAEAAKPVPSSEYRSSRQLELLAAAARVFDAKRALQYCDLLSWQDGSDQEAQAAFGEVRSLFADYAQLPSIDAIAKLASHYEKLADPALAIDDRWRGYFQMVAAQAGSDAILKAIRSGPVDASQVPAGTNGKVAMEYWQTVIHLLSYATDVTSQEERAAIAKTMDELSAACAQQFQNPDFYSTGLRDLGEGLILRNNLSARTETLTKAISVAQSDEVRLIAVRSLSSLLLGISEFERARAVVQEASGKMSSPPAREEMATMLRQIDSRRNIFEQRQAANERQGQLARLQAQLVNLEGRLADLKNRENSDRTMQSIQHRIEEIKSELAALKSSAGNQ